MKINVKVLAAMMMFVLLLVCGTAVAREVSPDFFVNEMAPDAQQEYLEQTGMSYEEAAGLATDPTDVQMIGCPICGDWFEAGEMYDNHICIPSTPDTPDPVNPGKIPGKSSNPTEAYYDALVNGQLDADKVTAQGTIYVNTANGKSLKMRNRPGTHGKVLTNLPNGTSLTLFWYENSSWAFVSYRGYFGFCMTRHLSDVPGTTPVKPSSNEATVASGTDTDLNNMFRGMEYVDYTAAVKPSNPTGFVNLRWAPTKAAPVQNIYYADELFTVIATNGTWSQVVHQTTGATGFMMNAFLNRLAY